MATVVWEWFAPSDLPVAVTITPPPLFSDLVKPLAGLNVLEAMDGSLTTVKRSKETKLHTWTFVLTRFKALEFKEFYLLHSASKIKIVTHEDVVIVGYFEINPTTFDTIGRGVISDSKEKVNLNITFKSTE